MVVIETTMDELLKPAKKFSTDVVEIESIAKNPEADRLYIYKLKGFELYLQSSTIFNVGEKAICFHVDSLLPANLESYLFPPESKVRLDKSRVRAIRVRGFISQGLLIKPENLEKFSTGISSLPVGADVSEKLGVTKYEPPVWDQPKRMQAGQSETKNPLFKEFTDPDHFRKNPDVLEEGITIVVISEKGHGTSARYSRLPFKRKVLKNSWIHRIKKLLGFKAEYDIVEEIQNCIGSRRVQIHMKPKDWRGFYDKNFWQIIEDKYQLTSKLPAGYILYGEIVGPQVQKGFHYGLKDGDVDFYAYDLSIDGKYVDYDVFMKFCDDHGIKRVPVLYTGVFRKDVLHQLEGGPSVIDPSQKVREGVVIRGYKDLSHPKVGRLLLKHINPEFLLLKTTDWE